MGNCSTGMDPLWLISCNFFALIDFAPILNEMNGGLYPYI